MIHIVKYDVDTGQLRCQLCGAEFEPTEAQARRRFKFGYRVGEEDYPCTLGVSVSEVITVEDKPL